MTAQAAEKAEIEEYRAAATLEEAVRCMAEGEATVLAGGSDLMLQTDEGRIAYRRTLLDITRIDSLRGVAVDGDRMTVGALTTVSDLLSDPLVASHAPILGQAADKFASSQIRNVATLGGNISNASPAGDMILPLLALDADVNLATWRDGKTATHSVPITEYFTGPGQTKRQPNELLTGVSFALPPLGHVGCFLKSGPRPALEISIVSAALVAVRDGGVLSDVRLAFGSVAPVPMRARQTEQFLIGKAPSADEIEEAGAMACTEVSPIDDIRSSAWYRNHLVRMFVRRLFDENA
jgi:CO/xanthine dehydrogenase FAD-binding subunit